VGTPGAQTEWVTGRVQKHPEKGWVRLMDCTRSAKGNGGRLSGVQVAGAEVDMALLRDVGQRPGWWAVIRIPLESEMESADLQVGRLIVAENDLSADNPLIEGG
jgi:hypothetical protein